MGLFDFNSLPYWANWKVVSEWININKERKWPSEEEGKCLFTNTMVDYTQLNKHTFIDVFN